MSKIITSIISLATLFSASVYANNVEIISKSVKSWQPVSVTEQDNLITISINTKQLTQDDYERISTIGLCPAFWNDNKDNSSLKKIKAINLLNKYQAAGFVLESPHSTCTKIGNVPPEKADIILLSNTHIYLP